MSRRCQIAAWVRIALLGSALRCALPLTADGPQSPQMTLEAGLQESIRLFRDGKHGAADGAFDQLERIFGNEPEYLDGSVQRVILPMRGYAALVAGDAPAAVEHLSHFLGTFQDAPEKSRRFALFALARAHQAAGEWEAAIMRYEAFVTAFPNTPEAGMASLRTAELQAEQGNAEAALATLDRLRASEQPLSLRQEARLRALIIAASGENRELAVRYLLESPWQMEAVSELASLAFTALPLGDYLLAEKRFDEAIAAYRLVPEREMLLMRQRQRLEEIRAALLRHSRGEATGKAGIWAGHYRQLAHRLENRLARMEESESHTAALYLRYGRAFAQAGRHYEAWTVFAELAENAEFDKATRQAAHYRWIVAVQSLERWADALEIAWTFVERYPEATQSPLVLFLNANAHQQLGEYASAITILTELFDRYPGHLHFGRWQFTRGFNKLLLEDNSGARADFSDYLTGFPDTALAANAALWHALAWYFDKDYPAALAELDALQAKTPIDHYLRPEIDYRRGAVLYARRDYEAALIQIDDYLARFPEDARRAEALVLRGDCLMGLGRLLPAAIAFRQVGPEARNLFPYAIFQTGKIFRAMEDYERLADHFLKYVGRTDLAFQPRVSEALYWIGWARERQGRPAEALPIFQQALDRYGNDPAATEMAAILGALHQLHKRLHEAELAADNIKKSALLATPVFMNWLHAEQERALAGNLPTYYSRLCFHEAERLERAGEDKAARELLLALGDTVPTDALDAEGLGKIGLLWQEIGREGADKFFEALLDRYPDSPQRASAWLGLGRVAFARHAPDEAAKWLQQLMEELPAHLLMPTASLLYGKCLIALGEPAKAKPVLETVLTLRSARGRPHAEALLILASAAEAQEAPDRAIAYYQRVYNLYRAYPDLVGRAYLRSAKLFEERDDLRAAWRTYREVLFFDDLTDASVREKARREMERLGPLLPPEAIESQVVETPPDAATSTEGSDA